MSRANTQKKAAAPQRRPHSKTTSVKRVTVDIVTGRELTSVYFDPSKIISGEVSKDADWQGLNYFAPAAVIKEEEGILTIRLPSGEVLKIKDAKNVTDNDDEGVDDILKLKDFSEMSLIHTLRVRYNRDEIYTLVGTILISLNPYKPIKFLYDESAVDRYHSKKQVSIFLKLFLLILFEKESFNFISNRLTKSSLLTCLSLLKPVILRLCQVCPKEKMSANRL